MDHQWRPMPPHPPSQGNICPICSNSHFPFCPPPLPPPFPLYNQVQNPRFPSHSDYQQPDPATYGSYNNFDYRGFGQPQMYDYNNNDGEDRRYKRPRVDENISLISLDNERRLKLVREHGGASSGNFTNMSYNNVDMNIRHQFEYSQNREPAHADHSLNLNQFNDSIMSAKSQYFHMNNHHQPPPYGLSNYYQSDMNDQGGCLPPHENRVVGDQHQHPTLPPLPPLPASPPPPVPLEPPLHPSPPPPPPPPPQQQTSLFPVPISSSLTNSYLQTKPSTAFLSEEWQTSSVPKQFSSDKPMVIDAFRLFKQPYRATRPEHIVIILRGLPGSGKSYLAKMIRDLEVENGGTAPRIHSMDDYFITEVEKIEENDASKSSGFVRGKKPTVKKVMEYCYEPEMEEAYRDSMLKAFKKTLEEGLFTLVIDLWKKTSLINWMGLSMSHLRSGYEVYISEATYKDPAGCAARNVHGFTLDEIKSMAGQWEEAPTLYLQLDIKSLFHGDDLKESGIQEIDMDTEDGTSDDNSSGSQERKAEKMRASAFEDDAPQVHAEGRKRWDAEKDHPEGGMKELLKSKWSHDLDEDDADRSAGAKSDVSALSGLIQAYGKQGKSLRWSDQVGNTGFSIGAAKKTSKSLVIGPGAGYNLKSNPLPKDGGPTSTRGIEELRGQSVFQERLRAERESFKAVFDKRRRRIGGLNLEEE
ncbi:YLP motif-containing protein 1 isoform X2 [Ricinus communis]|uniref:YLP motif-containing protein 1 isoform X2 n=1 Tax=Ricinus communis TaxID=3988 RepID=UPI00201A3D4F|nr:YLP motif-containing protein 1 isoform X2 [Ricinus communis]